MALAVLFHGKPIKCTVRISEERMQGYSLNNFPLFLGGLKHRRKTGAHVCSPVILNNGVLVTSLSME